MKQTSQTWQNDCINIQTTFV